MVELVVGAALLAVLALVLLLLFNRLVKLRNRVEAAWADLDVQLTRRRDLLPNLVTVVQAYAAHESRLFEAVTAARHRVHEARGARGRAVAETTLAEHVEQLLIVAEAYPDLKADRRFRELSDELTATENKIAFSRQLYNDTVDAYRTAAQSFPGVLIAGPLGFTPPDFFAAHPDERDPDNVRIRKD